MSDYDFSELTTVSEANSSKSIVLELLRQVVKARPLKNVNKIFLLTSAL